MNDTTMPDLVQEFLEYDVEQGSEEWWTVKKGVPSCSNFDRIITPARAEPSKQWEDYAAELCGDLLSDIPPEGVENFTNRATRWGEQCEAEARAWYGVQTGLEVRQVGWITTLDGRFGGSPDGLVGHTGGLELKCPQAKTHVTYCCHPEKLFLAYKCQVHGYLFVSKRQWWDLVSYCPGRLPAVKIRVEPDDFTAKLGAALEDFYPKFAAMLAELQKMP
jgi:hypothetical protein